MRSDVCLVLEGTYPYTAGGVSTWIQQILEAMPHLQFSILYIGAERDAPRSAKYVIPGNLVELREIYLQDYGKAPPGGVHRTKLSRQQWESVDRFQRALAKGENPPLREVCMALRKLKDADEVTAEFGHTKEAWDYAVKQYEDLAPQGTPFLNFFWTHRFINIPVLAMLRTELPRARVYHSACTGYAGMLAAKAAQLNGKPLVLTEHGIYLRERRIEIFNAGWILDRSGREYLDLRSSQSFFKEWWTRMFRSMSLAAYHSSDSITSLFEVNQQIQIAEGAPEERTSIIPNGIDIAPYANIEPATRTAEEPLRIGFVGRVTSIKDVKTFIQALGLLRDRNQPFEAFIIGPMEEEEGYVAECRELVTALSLNDRIKFTGRTKVLDYYKKLDVVVLTSLSEGLPFVILEANCAGLPVVATDVGACRELVVGRTAADRALGPSGLVTQVASPVAIAGALEQFARSPAMSATYGAAGRRRVLAHYDIRDVMHRYLELYEKFLFAGAESQLNRPAVGASGLFPTRSLG